ncbi:MAG: 1,2-phenylacetyl-CoA epoxidase subunit PaaD [Bacteroidia bacterium]|nr:phenylacetate-CoA oxygenase subunit PaaJ [Bacteroidia bacterium]MDW8014816.1 1,2-phenylacetyl-CoA epoxidase subunit PaaD [Bacteroidia bacterium]
MVSPVSSDLIRQWLRGVSDPEIPSVSVIDMGMIGEVRVSGKRVEVELVPTFAGCPAISLLKTQIETLLKEKGLEPHVEVLLTRPWRIEDVTSAGWEALRRAGFALPKKFVSDPLEMFAHVTCPRCGSESVSLSSPFGPTACRAIFRCHNCGEAFELFKPPL